MDRAPPAVREVMGSIIGVIIVEDSDFFFLSFFFFVRLIKSSFTTHLYSTNSCLTLFQCYNAFYFLCSLDKNLFHYALVPPIRSDYNVYESCDPNVNVTLSRHFCLSHCTGVQLPN